MDFAIRNDYLVILNFFQLPSLFQEKNLTAALQKAEMDEDPEIKRLLGLAVSHLQALKEMDRKYKEDEFHLAVKEVLFSFICNAPHVTCLIQ